MGKAVFGMLVAAALLWGCSPTDSGNGTADHPTPNAQIMVACYATVQTPAQSGRASYTVDCMFLNQDTTKSNSEFNSAAVTVNGVTLGRYSDGVFVNVGSMEFTEGDSLEFVIKHPKIGTVRQVLRIPESVPDYTLAPALPAKNFANSVGNFLVKWSAVDADLYYAQFDCYDAREFYMGNYGYFTPTDSMAVVVQDSVGDPFPFLEVRLMSFNYVPVAGFAPGSGFYVGCANYKVYSNL